MFHFSSNRVSRNSSLSNGIKTLSLIALVLFSTYSHAQKLEGSVHYLYTENIKKKFAALDYLNQGTIDNLALIFIDTYRNGNITTYPETLYLNATQTKFEQGDMDTYIITHDFSKQIIHDIIDVQGKTYLIEDSLRPPRWLIKNEMKEIAGHVCMNAFYNDTLKHQKIMAWYALDIPIQGGPERFYGAPGLILEVDINDGALVITADKIELKKLTTELDFPKKVKGKKIKEKDYFEILRKKIAENRNNHDPLFNGLRY
jgi:GLPGLI family protein